MFKSTLLCVFVAVSMALAAPAALDASSTSSLLVSAQSSSTSSAPSEAQTVPPASDDPNFPEWSQDTNATVEAERGTLGATILTDEDIQIEEQNPDSVAPPTTDNGIL